MGFFDETNVHGNYDMYFVVIEITLGSTSPNGDWTPPILAVMISYKIVTAVYNPFVFIS